MPYIANGVPECVGQDQGLLSPQVVVDLRQIGVGHHGQRVAPEAHQDLPDVQQSDGLGLRPDRQDCITLWLRMAPMQVM